MGETASCPTAPSNIRNVALAGHPGAGKTTLFEALLHAGGAIQTAGSVERGSTVSDFDPIEKTARPLARRGDRQHRPRAAASIHVNLIDTPGYPDFRGPALSALAAVETVAIVVDADSGIEYGTRRMMEYAKARNLCRVLVVNKIDHADADSAARCSTTCARPSAPNACRSTCPPTAASAVIDCFGNTDRRQRPGPGRRLAPEDHRPGRRDQRDGDGALPRPRRGRPVGRGTARRLRAMPARGPPGAGAASCSARSGAGVKELLDVAEKLFPNPAEAQPAAVRQGQRRATPQPIEAAPDPKAHVIADVFKIVNDPFVGKLGIFRVYQGTVKQRHAAVRRRRQEAVQGRPPVQAQGQGPRRDRPGDPRRHRRGRQGRRTALRRGAARQPRRGPDPPRSRWTSPSRCSAWRSRRRTRARSRSWPPRCTSWPRRIPCFAVEHNAETQRDRDPRPVRPAPARQSSSA